METPEHFCSRRVIESPLGAHIRPPHEDMVPGEDTVHGTRPGEAMKFDVLTDGESGSLGKNGGLDDEILIKNSFKIDGDRCERLYVVGARRV